MVRDLELPFLAECIAADRPERRHAVVDALTNLPLDPEVTAWRAGVMADLMEGAALCDGLQEAERALRLLAAHRPQAFAREVPRAARIGARVVELQAYVDAVHLLGKALVGASIRSAAFTALRADVIATRGSPEFGALMEDLPRWRHTLDEIRSVTIAVNVSSAMEPESAVIVGFSSTPAAVGEASLTRLLGPEVGARGITRLFRRQPVDWGAGDSRLVADVQALLEAAAAPVERALHAYRLINAQAVAHLEDELLVLLGAARLARTWRAAGLPSCVAEVLPDGTMSGGAPPATAATSSPSHHPATVPAAPVRAAAPPWNQGESADVMEDTFLPALAARMRQPDDVIPNRVEFGPSGRIWVLTGPNRGGKTTFLRTVGVAQVLGQCGLAVPARRARLHVVDGIFTHFPELEAGRAGHGRLDEEAERLSHIFAACTPRGLVLLNEVLAGTSAPEGVALATDVLRGFRALGCRVVYATHLHELAMRCAEINASVAGDAIVASLIAEAEAGEDGGTVVRRPTYRVVPGTPEGASFFASSIARHHGISLPQILERLRARGLAAQG